MYCILTIIRYPKYLGWAGFLSMALFRLPLWLDTKTRFWKLMGCGRNGSFDMKPDWQQWAILQVLCMKLEIEEEDNTTNNIPSCLPSFITKYHALFRCEIFSIVLEPLEGHGLWDGKQVFGSLPKNTGYEGAIAVLTRASIRLNKLNAFWQNVDKVSMEMKAAPGFIYSLGIGELPFIKQATLSVWQSSGHMKQFAYQMERHKDVIRKTRQEHWYSEEMFVRLKVCAVYGTLNGAKPLKSIAEAG